MIRNGDVWWWRDQFSLTQLAARSHPYPSVVWALLDGVSIDDERGWDGSNGMPAKPWHDPITYDEYRRRLDSSRKVRRHPDPPGCTGYLVGRNVITPKQKPGGDWRECWWNGQPHAEWNYTSSLIEGPDGVAAAAVFPSRGAALRALMASLREPLRDRRRAWALKQLDVSFIVGRRG